MTGNIKFYVFRDVKSESVVIPEGSISSVYANDRGEYFVKYLDKTGEFIRVSLHHSHYSAKIIADMFK